jgi:hypothetical protein
MWSAVRLTIEQADKLLAKAHPRQRQGLYVVDPRKYRHDVLESLVEIVYDALTYISNDFVGFDDQYWLIAIETFQRAFPSIGEQPDGMTPFQQRLALKIIDKLEDNMNGFYPSICRVLLSCVGPYGGETRQKNRTAFNILMDAMYYTLQERLPQLAANNPEKLADFLPNNVTFDLAASQLTHIYRGGEKVVTDLTKLKLLPISLMSAEVRRAA